MIAEQLKTLAPLRSGRPPYDRALLDGVEDKPVVLNARYPASAGGKHVGELIPGCARRLVLRVVRTEFACLSTRLAAGLILLKARNRRIS
ncbi:hypothetical protein ASE60_32965 [Ensifer sp. Root278]|nr:hypothetical protein ASE60_32965 [Ensifer sp. Root278]